VVGGDGDVAAWVGSSEKEKKKRQELRKKKIVEKQKETPPDQGGFERPLFSRSGFWEEEGGEKWGGENQQLEPKNVGWKAREPINTGEGSGDPKTESYKKDSDPGMALT